MATVTVELDAELVAKLGSADVAAGVARVVALQLFRDHEISLARAAELAQTPLDEFRAFARIHGERPPDDRDVDEDAREQRAIQYLDSLGLSAPQWLEESWQSARATGADELTTEEIQQEIAASRRERRRT